MGRIFQKGHICDFVLEVVKKYELIGDGLVREHRKPKDE